MGADDRSRNLRRQRKIERKRQKDRDRERKEASIPRPEKKPRKRVVHSEAILTPVVFRDLTLEGKPTEQDLYNLAGREIAYWWYDSQEDRRLGRNGEQVSVLEISSCRINHTPRVTPDNDWRLFLQGAEYFHCEAVLIEHVSADSRYGKWLREQENQGSIALTDKSDFIEKPIEFDLVIGVPTKAVLRWKNPWGISFVPKQPNILQLGFEPEYSNTLSALQVDRVWEFFRKLLHLVPRIAGNMTHTKWERDLLNDKLASIETEEAAAAARLGIIVDEALIAQRKFLGLKREFAALEAKHQETCELAAKRVERAKAHLAARLAWAEESKADFKAAERRTLLACRRDSPEHADFDRLRRETERLGDIVRNLPSSYPDDEAEIRRAEARKSQVDRTAAYELAVLRASLEGAKTGFESHFPAEQIASGLFDELLEARDQVMTRLLYETVSE